MTRVILILTISLSVTGCLPDSSKLKISLAKQSNSKSTIGSARVTSVEVINNQLIITGSQLNSVTNVLVDSLATDENFSIETKSDTQITANSVRAFSFDISKVFNLILSDAEASATFTIDFSLCNATLNGKGFNCAAPVSDKDVLAYDAVSGKWKPRPASGLNYLGTFDASSNPGAGPAIQPAGAYYVISDDGTIAAASFAVGDWLVSNGSTWQKIDNSSAVLSVHGRYGAITAQKGDYTLNLLGDVNFPTAPVANQFLKFDGTNWVPGDVAAVTETDPTVRAFAKAALPTCGAGQVLKADGTNFSCVTDSLGAFSGTANRIVATNGSGALTVTAISDTVLGYLSGVTSNIQTQIDSKLNWAISGLETIHPSRLNLTVPNAGKAVITDGSGFVSVSPTTSTQLGYLSTTTSNVQTQLTNLGTTKADLTNGAQTITALSVTGLGAPSSGSDATNRDYVDTAITNNGVWAKGASNSINYLPGAVGIGINNPAHPLTILAPGSTTPSYVTWYNSTSPPPIGVYSDSGPAGSMDVFIAGASSSAGIRPVLLGRKSGGTLDTPTALANGDTILSFLSSGYDGADFRNNASVDFAIGDVVSVGSLPTDILFKTGSVTRAEKMRLNSLGNLGLGTTQPDSKLHILGSYATAPTPLGGESSIILESNPGSMGAQGYTGSLWFGSREISRTEGSAKAAGIVGFMPDDVTATNAQSDLLFFTTRAGTVTADEKMRLTSAGFLGIGTSTPSTTLDITSTTPSMRITNPNVTLPDYSTAGFTPALSPNTTTQWVNYSNNSGGFQLAGFTKAGTSTGVPAAIVGYHGDIAPTTAAVALTGYKWNGVSSRVALSGTEIVAQIVNAATPLMTVLGSGNIGLGTTLPLAPIHVNVPNIGANILVSSDNGYAQYLLNATTAGTERKWAMKANDGNGAFAINEDALAASNRFTILEGGNTGIGTISPTAKLEVAGTTKLGTDGVSFNSMGGCIIASTAISTTATTYTCTGVPASTAVAINCSGSAAMTTPGTSAVYCRPTGTLDSVTCNTTVANSVAMTWNCMWMKI